MSGDFDPFWYAVKVVVLVAAYCLLVSLSCGDGESSDGIG